MRHGSSDGSSEADTGPTPLQRPCHSELGDQKPEPCHEQPAQANAAWASSAHRGFLYPLLQPGHLYKPKDSGSNEGGILGIAKVHLQCQEVSNLSQNTYVCNGLSPDQNPTHFTVSATPLICSFQEGNHQLNYKKNVCFVWKSFFSKSKNQNQLLDFNASTVCYNITTSTSLWIIDLFLKKIW